MQVRDSVAVVTGGGSGMGDGFVRMMNSSGGKAAIFDLPSSAKAISNKGILNENVRYFPVDVTDPASVEQGMAETYTGFGRIDVVVNCAGVSPAARIVDREGALFPLDVFRSAVDINLIGLFDVVRTGAGYMTRNEPTAEGERGLIVNVASIAGLEGQMGQAAYSASKGGVIALTLPLARDLAEWGIRVMTICPGIMDTPMLAGVSARRREALLDIHVFPKRLGTAEDFARLARSFMENTLLNGEVVRLDAATRL